MIKQTTAVVMLALGLTGCSDAPDNMPEAKADTSPSVLTVQGQWIKEADGSIMADPQTSGLTHVNGMLATLSDASAQTDQQRRIHVLNPANATLLPKPESMRMATEVRRSCFANYLKEEPDLEALVVDPQNQQVFYTVTEDATRTGALSVRCQQRFAETGSTDYPTLLVRLFRDDDGTTTMTNVRPVSFPASFEVGDFPNDGIEGMAMTPERLLYLGLEKDKAGQPRIFSVQMDEAFWESQDFIEVTEPQLAVPQFESGNHPINGLEYYYHQASQQGFLLAAARNDNELWVISENNTRPTARIVMQFTAPVEDAEENCPATEVMDNASIEGLAVIDSTLWLINDPWKKNYLKNVQCGANQSHYNAMAPLLFSVPLDEAWFTE
ncbi:hypothetical protein [Alteromonas sp. H39]|uniref:hypothetical protein n=1 Tax=Alteromonas sp. H39 TaxID=3389876 RepID=UPI0039E087CE